MKVLVTGGRGFIGEATCRALMASGHVPFVFDRPNDVRSAYEIEERMKDVDAVIHLAGLLGTSELFDNPGIAVDINVGGTVNILEACKKHGARFVGIGMPDSGWKNVYSATKGCARDIATAYHESFGVPVTHVVAYNAYGPGQKFGPGHPQKVVPTFATRAWRGRPIPIWGDGTQTVDLVHVVDIALMLAQAIEMPGDNDVYDAGTGVAVSVQELAKMIATMCGSRAGLDYMPMRPGERPQTKIVAPGRGWDRLGWKPEFDWNRVAATVGWYAEVMKK